MQISRRPGCVRFLGNAVLLTALWSCLLGPGDPWAKDSDSDARKIREPVFAGSWYPDSPSELRRLVEGYLERVPAGDSSGRLLGLISPHAGYLFSGATAGYSYRLLRAEKPSTVILIAPSHHMRFSGVAAYPGSGFRTPLGILSVDRAMTDCLGKEAPKIQLRADAFEKEHSVEVQLPFLQVAAPDCRIVALVMGEQDLETCRWLADALVRCIEKRPAVLVASSDLSHFHPYDQARSLDKVVQERVAALDPEGLSRSLSRNLCEACGGGPMVTAMIAARAMGGNRAQVLHYANSGDVAGDLNRVVGYMAAAIWADSNVKAGPEPSPSNSPRVGVDLGLSSEDKAQLRKIARERIEAHCAGKKAPHLPSTSPKLAEPRGAFVTLNRHGQLRGCIGRIISDQPLAETVAEMAVAAATRDPRFPPVTSSELKEIEIEISALTPFRKVSSPEEIQVGTHGLYVRRNGSAGLLLPQVAVEHGWDRQTFLEQTCNKARLPRDAWKDPRTEIYVFSADVF